MSDHTLALLSLLSIPISVVALLYTRRSSKAAEDSRDIARDALAVGRSQRAIQAEAVLMEQRKRDDDDAPDFVLTAEDEPQRPVGSNGEVTRARWPIQARMISGPNDVRVRWQWSAEVQGPEHDTGGGLQVIVVDLAMGGPIGPLDIVRDDRFTVMVDCPPDTVALTSCTVTMHCEEIDTHTGEPTGRKWPVSRSVTTVGGRVTPDQNRG